MQFENSLSFALSLDAQDELKPIRDKFFIPKHNGKDAIYLCGNSLGLQPKSVKQHIQTELDDWATLGVEGHLQGKNPWYYYHHFTQESLAKLTGAQANEVVAMGSLTNNLHLLLISFYQPTKTRYKILIENRPFPSDTYAIKSQINLHGFNEADALIEMPLKPGQYCNTTQEILDTIALHKDELALVILGGVNFYTGQLFDMQAITKAAHSVGAYCGFDLAHGMGNATLQLHDWQVDFACWCSYKYLNSGPGSVAGIFVHSIHHNNAKLPRLNGWWGHNEKDRFKMEPDFDSMNTAEAWQLSNAPVLTLAAHKAALEIFDEVGIEKIHHKRDLLSNYFYFLIKEIENKYADIFEVITPNEPSERACQVSLLFKSKGRMVFDALTNQGVIADWREPGVIRMAAVPLYNTFEDVYTVSTIINNILSA